MEERVEDNKQKFKFLTPIYIPVKKLQQYLSQDITNLETKILKSIYFIPSKDTSRPKLLSRGSSENVQGKFVFRDSEDIVAENLIGFQQRLVSKKALNNKTKEPKRSQRRKLMSRLAAKANASGNKKSNSVSSPAKGGSHPRSPAKNTRGASNRSNDDSSPILTNAMSDTQSG